MEDDEDDFPNTRTDGEFLHNNNGSKEKCESGRAPSENLLSVFLFSDIYEEFNTRNCISRTGWRWFGLNLITNVTF